MRVDRSYNGPEWVITAFLPRVQREFGRHLCVAFLVLPNHLSELAEESRAILAAEPAAPLQYARFIDEGAANAWLDAHRRRSGA